jgi:hypothetical protein
MKTVEFEGKIYEVGKYYEFKDDGDEWYAGVLRGVKAERSYPFRSSMGDYDNCREMALQVGKITDAPINLIDSEYYKFTGGGFKTAGFYNKANGKLCVGKYYFNPKDCTDIIHMVESNNE